MCGAASMATTSPADVCPLLLIAIAAYACCGSRRPGMGGRDRCGPSRLTSHHHHLVATDVTTDRSEMSSHAQLPQATTVSTLETAAPSSGQVR